MSDLKRILLGYDGDIDYALRRLEKLEKVAKAAKAALSEDGAIAWLSAYGVGMEFIKSLVALESE